MIPPELRRYVDLHQPPLPPLFEKLRKETTAMTRGQMLFSRDSADLVRVLVRAIGAKRALEVGTFTGYSSLTIATALPSDGKLICCDVSEEWTAVARRYWRDAGVDSRVELRLAPASDTLAALLREGRGGSFDFALIDADKVGYLDYYEKCFELLRRDGVLALDNTIWSGAVADPTVRDEDTEALRAVNRRIRDDARVDAVLLTIGDGLTLARKK
jgi:predicted O-methyltransferase YrrM